MTRIKRPFVLLLTPLMFLHCWGAKTGLLETPAALVTFRQAVGSVGAWHNEIFENPPAAAPGGRSRVAGLWVLDHAMHPSGEWLAYTTSAGLFVQDSQGYTTQRSTLGGIHQIDWSPDARRIAFGQGSRIFVIETGGSNPPSPITDAPLDESALRAMSPSWTPDGARVVFLKYRTGIDTEGDPTTFGYEVWSVGADGGDPRLLHSGPPEPSQPGVAVSRDGTKVLYAAGFDPHPFVVQLDLASGATITLLSDASQPAFSASGSHLAFVRNRKIWVCRLAADACLEEHMVSNGPSELGPSWIGW